MLTVFAAGGVLAVAWFVTALILFVLPAQQPLHHADAIVTLAPGTMRIATAQRAIDEGAADEFWISYLPQGTPDTDGAGVVVEACAPDAPRAVVTTCFTPRSDNTIGEARMVAELVATSGTKSVIVTTEVTHSARAKFLFERCLPAGTDVQMLLVEEPPGWRHLLQRMGYETAAFAKAVLQAHLCD
ncbi:MAG: YdcF family protein [Microbacterium sp.]